ncbi:MAG TPA: SHOCT domain-containing protein, partial [Bacteroidales bacterium]|nr:SHOCT domain-containing protein [Bacteroidales bacterium]
KILNDSIVSLNKENTELKTTIEMLKVETADKTKVVNDLKQLKELLDTGIITQAEFDAKKAALLEKL